MQLFCAAILAQSFHARALYSKLNLLFQVFPTWTAEADGAGREQGVLEGIRAG